MKHLGLAAFVTLLGLPALAHPGHDAHPATHWVADLPHLAVAAGLAALAVVVIGAVRARRRGKAQRGRS